MLVLYLFLTFVAGIVVMLAFFGLYQIYKVIKQLADAIAKVHPEDIAKAMLAVQVLSSQFGELMNLLRQLNQGFVTFSGLMFARPEDQRGPVGTGPIGGSGVYTYDEDEMAKQDEARKLREVGWETDPRRSNQPSIPAVNAAKEAAQMAVSEPPIAAQMPQSTPA